MPSDDDQDIAVEASELKDTENELSGQTEDVTPVEFAEKVVEEAAGSAWETAVSADDDLYDSDDGPLPEVRLPSRSQRQRRPHARRSGHQPQSQVSVDAVLARFAACDRCSYFLTGYYSKLGLDNLQTAVSQIDAGWLTLTWSPVTRTLVETAYGTSVDRGHYYYEGCCPNCHRAFTFWAKDEAAQPDFQISM
ncbi:MAG: hypothetical protein KC443_23640 [Anaerolineales bacterium]|nr:hypothetical protein [Anaerolineales bacterium]MCB8967001.1 hypothetical protein [Ardenticatenaceae bacterium]